MGIDSRNSSSSASFSRFDADGLNSLVREFERAEPTRRVEIAKLIENGMWDVLGMNDLAEIQDQLEYVSSVRPELAPGLAAIAAYIDGATDPRMASASADIDPAE